MEEPVKVYGLEEDFHSIKLRAAAKAAACPDFSFHLVKGTAGKAISPRGYLPTLHVGKEIVYGSSAIARTLCRKAGDAGTKLLGATPFEQAEVLQWLEYTKDEIEVKASVATFPLLGTPLAKFSQHKFDSAKLSKEVIEGLIEVLQGGVEKHLMSRTFLVGKALTLADITLCCTLLFVFELVIDPATRKSRLLNTTRWFTTCFEQAGLEELLGRPLKLCTASPLSTKTTKVGSKSSGKGGKVTASTTTIAKAGGNSDTKISELFQRTRTRVKDILGAPCKGESFIGQQLVVCGWARTVRFQQKNTLAFIDLSDGSCFDSLQVVATLDETEGFASLIKAGGIGSSHQITGTLVASPKEGQAVEFKASVVNVLGTVDPAAYPLKKTKHAHSMEFLRENAHLRARSNITGAVARVRNACAFATHRFFQERGFQYVHTPIITGSDCEGAGEMFQVTTLLPSPEAPAKVPVVTEKKAKELAKRGEKAEVGAVDYSEDFFGKPTFLTVSGQLNVETYACALSDVYTFGPTFRAENSHTARHLAEFWMIEPEFCFGTLEDDMNLAEDYLKFCTQYVLDNCAGDIQFFDKRVEKGLVDRLRNVVSNRFQRLTYTEAIEVLNKPEHLKQGNFEEEPVWGIDLGSEHERFLTEKVYKKPVIITNYPFSFKAFYMLKNDPDSEGRETVQAMDILVPKIGEIIGGSAREYRTEMLVEAMKQKDVDAEHLEWYTQLRRFGGVPHAGFGLGFERLVMFVTGVENIRDVIPFPRTPGQCSY